MTWCFYARSIDSKDSKIFFIEWTQKFPWHDEFSGVSVFCTVRETLPRLREYLALCQILTKTISHAVSYLATVQLWLASLFQKCHLTLFRGACSSCCFSKQNSVRPAKKPTKSPWQINLKWGLKAGKETAVEFVRYFRLLPFLYEFSCFLLLTSACAQKLYKVIIWRCFFPSSVSYIFGNQQLK